MIQYGLADGICEKSTIGMSHQVASERTNEYESRKNLNPDPMDMGDFSIEREPVEQRLAPYDTCLPGLYRDWREFSVDQIEFRKKHGILGARILIDRTRYQIRILALMVDGSTKETYRGDVAVGAAKSPTPRGSFIINHIYCYPDVIFFASESQPLANLYRGLFVPLQICDGFGRCQRYNELGLHGFELSAHPSPETIQPGVFGANSAGCVRIADPCSFKRHLITLAGVGKVLKNDRGSYHWLNKNVDVEIFDQEPELTETITLAKILEEGLTSVVSGFRNVINIFGP
ncbi:MAG: L,D-transpeptidase [Pseudomonadota bacterium]